MSSVALTKGPFPGFKQLAATVWYYEPQENTSNGVATATNQPDLVVLSTWMGAAPKHILKYIVGYQELYPKSPILMLTNTIMDIILRTRQSYKDKLKPALRIIRDAAMARDDPKILLHLYSNGGANHAASLAYFYRQQYNAPLPVSGMILDSAPGVATYRRSIAAMAVGLPQFILGRILGYIIIHIMCAAMWVTHHIFKRENIISQIRRQLVDPTLFPTSSPRVYIYSETDKMVGWKDVEYNAQLAKEAGYRVQTERYGKSAHCGHLRTDPRRYWDAVQRSLK